MAIFRGSYLGFPRSENCQLYGKKDGSLLAPIDLVLASGLPVFIGAPIRDEGGVQIGVINNYTLPNTTPGNLSNPIVSITPESFIDLDPIPDGFQSQSPNIGQNASVSLKVGLTMDTGTIKELPSQLPYPEGLGSVVVAYVVHFNSTVKDRKHGGRVLLNNDGSLLGMLIYTQEQPNGTTRALVYPAHLV
jgi:hypothetical protein